MGKTTGFIEYQRLAEAAQPPSERIRHYREFTLHLNDSEAKQQGARCMDCGIPYCHNGCPVNNLIPDFNDLVYRQNWREALDTLHSTNNFPEFTGRVCPAPCEAACTLNINNDAVGIKSIEHAIIDRGWENGWIAPQPATRSTGKRVAIVGSGPAGLAAAQQLARAGHSVVVFEKSDRIGGLLRYGIPDFKLEKNHIDQRVTQMQAEGVQFRVNQHIGADIPMETLLHDFDAVIVAGGAEQARDLPVPGRELAGVHFAMEYLPQQNRVVAGDTLVSQIMATGKHVIVIGGGDTGSDCVGTANRQGAASVTQFELLPQPPEHENKPLTWPYWPVKLRTSSSHEEGCQRDWAIATQALLGNHGRVETLRAVRLTWQGGKMQEIAGSAFDIKADLVLLAMGFTGPTPTGLVAQLSALGVGLDGRGNVAASVNDPDHTTKPLAYQTAHPKIFAAGDMRRGQSLVVWAIREGRQCARAVDTYLMGSSLLPR